MISKMSALILQIQNPPSAKIYDHQIRFVYSQKKIQWAGLGCSQATTPQIRVFSTVYISGISINLTISKSYFNFFLCIYQRGAANHCKFSKVHVLASRYYGIPLKITFKK